MTRRSTVNGIPALWTEGPEPYTAALVVGAGVCDETLRTAGVAHLVEHLVMAAMPRTTLETNAWVDDELTVFHATGPREAVDEWLGTLCRVVRDLPLERLEVEARVLEAEDGAAAPPALAFMAGARYGTDGVGALGRHGAPSRTLTRDHVRDFVARRYVSGNAVVISTGAPPEHADVRLPDGARPTRPEARESCLALPGYVADPPVPLASWLVERTPVAPVLLTLVIEALTRSLRHDQGLVYEVDGGSSPVDDATLLAVLWADGAEEGQVRVLESTVGVLRDLAASGPEPSELAHEQAVARQRLTDPRGTVDRLVVGAYRLLAGRPVRTAEEESTDVEAVTREDVARAAARALETLLLAGTRPAPGGIAGVPDRTDDEPPPVPEVTGRPWTRRLLSTAPRDLRVVIGESGMTQTAHGHRHGGSWADLRGVAQGPDFRALVFADGGQTTVWPGHLRNGAEAIAEIDRRAGVLAFEVDADWL